jgi:hypothetical protein
VVNDDVARSPSDADAVEFPNRAFDAGPNAEVADDDVVRVDPQFVIAQANAIARGGLSCDRQIRLCDGEALL